MLAKLPKRSLQQRFQVSFKLNLPGYAEFPSSALFRQGLYCWSTWRKYWQLNDRSVKTFFIKCEQVALCVNFKSMFYNITYAYTHARTYNIFCACVCARKRSGVSLVEKLVRVIKIFNWMFLRKLFLSNYKSYILST